MATKFMMLSKEVFETEDYLLERFTRREALFDLFYLAAYKDRTFKIRGIVVEQKAGQVAKSIRELAGRWHWSVNTVQRYLKELESDGIIDTQKSTVIQVITIKKYLILNTQSDTQTDTQFDTQTDTPIIHNIKDNIKEKETDVSKKKKKEKSFDVREDLSYVDCFADLWNDWLDYKDEIKKQYKTQRGAKSAFTQLKNLSGNDYYKAKAILEQSYRKSWDGFYDIKDWNSNDYPSLFSQQNQVPQESKKIEWE